MAHVFALETKMIGKVIVAIALGCVMAVSCLPSQVDIYNGNTTTSSWDDNLPPSPFTNEQIEKWIEEIRKSTVSLHVLLYCIL